jgi:MFS family permease
MKIYYGWIIVAVGIVVSCVGMGTMMSLGVFLQPITQDTGWSRTGVSAVSTLNFLAMGFGSFLWGSLSDRFGSRIVVLCGGLVLGFGLAAASQVGTLLAFQIVYGVSVGLAIGAFFVPLTALTTRWFTRHRSLAVSLVSAGLALGTTLIAPLSRWIMMTHDWRYALLVLSAMALAIILPAALLLREPPEAPREARATSGAPASMTVAQALRTPQFAAIAGAFFMCCAAHSGPIFHMVSYAADCGVPAMAAATVFSVAGLSAMSGRVVCGIVADRTGAKQTLVSGLALQALAVSLYLFTSSLGSFYAVAALFGFAYGGVMPLYAILVREYFPANIMGSVFGVVAMVSTFGMALGPPLGGFLFDRFGGYVWLYVGSMGFAVAAVAVALTVRPPRLAPVAELSPTAA